MTLLTDKKTTDVADFMALETRFKIVERADKEHYERLVKLAQGRIENRLKLYDHLAKPEV